MIIPNYNHTRYISDAIISVLRQSCRSFEIIVVDDGSTDDSREVVSSFGDQVRYIWQENQGLAGARNTGIRAAQGELIGLLDADDEWLPDFLETMISLATRHSDAAVLYSSARGMDMNGLDLPQMFGGPALPPHRLYRTLLRANFLIPSTIIMRRPVVVAAGLFDRTLRSCEDWDLWLRLLPRHNFVGTSRCLVRYRLHGNSLSNNPSGMQQATQAVIEKQFGPDDGQWLLWTPEKRLAYGGVYRFCLLTSVQRCNDWGAGAQYLRRALRSDPTLARDLDLFYDLALGNQPPGYRGTPYNLDLEANARQIWNMLDAVFGIACAPELLSLRRQTLGTAHFALGLVAYNTGRRTLCRGFLSKALTYRPDLWRNSRLTANLVKSFVSQAVLERVKRH